MPVSKKPSAASSLAQQGKHYLANHFAHEAPMRGLSSLPSRIGQTRQPSPKSPHLSRYISLTAAVNPTEAGWDGVKR